MRSIPKISSHNLWAIIFFNFKFLPFRQAVKLPFDFYHNIRFENLRGRVILKSDKIYRGMIKFGGRGSEMFSGQKTIIDLKGEIIFQGPSEIGYGSLLRVEKNGLLIFGNHVRLGALTKVFCENEIVFEDEIDFSWECQIFDTNFHEIEDIETKTNIPITSPIHIGSYNWFGNRCTIMKGTVTRDWQIIASNSLCNKDYTSLQEFSVLGGIPAKQIGENKKRIFENLLSTLNE